MTKRACRAFVSRKIRKLRKERKKRRQAIAIALNMARARGCPIGRRGKQRRRRRRRR